MSRGVGEKRGVVGVSKEREELGPVSGQGCVGDTGHKAVGIQLCWFCCARNKFSHKHNLTFPSRVFLKPEKRPFIRETEREVLLKSVGIG